VIGVIVDFGNGRRPVYWRHMRRNRDGPCGNDVLGFCDYIRLIENNSGVAWCSWFYTTLWKYSLTTEPNSVNVHKGQPYPYFSHGVYSTS
jgi:hypothetical protein